MRYLLRITLLVYFSLTGLTGCDNTDDPANNNEGIAIPVAIATVALPAGSTLVANLYVDKEIMPEPVDFQTVNKGESTVSFVDIPVTPGRHTFTLEFTYELGEEPPIILASANLQKDLAPGSSTPVNFIEDDYIYPDDDEDNIDNLTEIENGSDPNNRANIPPRVSRDLISLYEFQEGTGSVVSDSVVSEQLNLTIQDSEKTRTDWLPEGGLSIIADPDPLNPDLLNLGTLLSSDSAATKIINAAKESNELTVEFWAKPANDTQEGTGGQGSARIVTISEDKSNRNMTIGQVRDSYQLRFRSSVTDDNGRVFKQGEEKEGESVMITSPENTVTTDDPSHVVITRDKSGMLRLYINNQPPSELLVGGNLSNWGDYKLAFANELIDPRPWLGELHLVAIYSKALSAEEVNLNYIVGVKTVTQSEMAEN